jgi:WD40 repeat protein/energy-coupling factor transporter ATP-binding protein EcfA2
MPEIIPGGLGNSDPANIRTRQDFARALTLIREFSGRTVRDVARAVGIPDSTAGGYFSGRHLPPIKPHTLLIDILAICGITAPADTARWREALARLRRSPGRRAADSATPYRGLESFQPEDAEWFHGRERQTQELVERVAAQWPEGGPVAVVGPSGSGKSSLLRAGLIPAFSGGNQPVAGVSWQSVLFTPGAHPSRELRQRLAITAPRDGLLIVVDQFEELFTLCTEPAERQEFLTDLFHPSVTALVVLGMRADFYPQASRHDELVSVLQNAQIVVGPMTRDELRQSIVEPARKARVEVEDGLVELLLRDLAPGPDHSPDDAGALPLLSHALLSTWQRAQRGRMTVADYESTGGISGAISWTAEAAYGELTEPQRHTARQLFLRMIHLGDRSADTRRQVPYSEILPDESNDQTATIGEVLDLFVERRLVTTDTDTVNICHEALLIAWPRLRGWIDTDRAGLRIHRQLTKDAHEWVASERDPGALYRGGRLVTATEWASEPARRNDLNTIEREFLDASTEQQEFEQRARRRRTRQLRRLVAALTVLVLIAGLLTAYVFQQRATAVKERDDAISRQLAGEANRLRDHDISLAMQLSLAAYQISPTPEARASLLDTTAYPATTRSLGPEGTMQTVALTPDGQIMAAGGTDKTVRLWRLEDGRQPAQLGGPLAGATDTIFSVQFSPNGKLLAVGGGDRTVRLWDITNPDSPVLAAAPLSGAGNTIYSVAFSPDTRILAAGSADNQIHLWDISEPRQPRALPPLTGFTNYVQAVAFSPDGRTLAAGSADGSVRLWDTSEPTAPTPLGAPLTGPARKVFTIAFSPDGRTIAAGSADKNVYLWDLTDPRAPRPQNPLTGATSWVNSVAFNPDGRTLAVGSSDNTVRLWDVGARTVSRTLPHPAPVTAVTFLDNGKRLATGAADGVARLWAVPGPVITDSADAIFNVPFGPTGRLLLTGSGVGDSAFRLWDITDHQHPRLLGPPHTNPVPGNRFVGTAALSPDGRTAAAAGLDGPVQLWDIEDPEHATPLGTPLTGPTALTQYVAFSPDGRILAAGGEDKTAWLWDISDRQHPKSLPPLTGATNHVYSVEVSPDGRTVAVGSLDRTIRLWDITNQTAPIALTTLTGPTNYVYQVTFSPNGRILAATSADKTVRFWDLSDRTHPTPLGEPLTGPTNYVYSVAYSPDGNMIAASSADKTVWLWDVVNPEHPVHLATLTAATGAVHAVTFSPDGRTIAAGTSDRTALLWTVDPDLARDYICATTGDAITQAEWNQYVRGVPYRRPCR